MTRTRWEPLYIAAEVDVDDQRWAGVADYGGTPHLVLGELLVLDQPQARRRLGQAFFLIAISRREFREILREWKASQPSDDADPKWKQKQARWEAVWARFKHGAIRRAESAWRVRGSFREATAKSGDSGLVCWTPLRKTPVSDEHVRARLARIEELTANMFGNKKPLPSGNEVPF
jgi:hypothetical protein